MTTSPPETPDEPPTAGTAQREHTAPLPPEQPTDSAATGASTWPPPDYGRPPRRAASRLQRSSSDKVLTGVCGGLGQQTGVDPILFRIGFVALVFAGGTGILLYIAMAVLMPRDDGQQIWSRSGGLPWARPTTGQGEPGIGPEIRIGDREREQAVAYLSAALREGRLDLSEYDERIATAYQAKTAGDLIQLTADLRLATGEQPPFASTPAYAQPVAVPQGPRSPIPRLTVAVLLIGSGVVALGGRLVGWSVDPSTFLAIAVASIGVALLVTAFGPWRRSKGALIALGVVLSFGLFLTSAVDGRGGFGEGSFGERTYRPLSVDQVRDSYQLVMGDSTLDLSRVDFPAGERTTIEIEVTMGNFEILAPRDADVLLNGNVRFGSMSAFGERDVFDGFYPGLGNGPGVADAEPELILDVDVRFGNAEVTRVG